MDEEEENVLLEILIASLQLTLHPPAVPGFQRDKARLKAQQDETSNEVGRLCVGLLPQLFLKYGVDATRIRSVLVIPQLVPLNVYLDMRMLAVGVYDTSFARWVLHVFPPPLSLFLMYRFILFFTFFIHFIGLRGSC